MHANNKVPQIVAFTGLPGTGKSTLAEALARVSRTPVYASDWLMGSLKPYRVFDGMDEPTYLALYDGLAEALAARQLMLGQSAITDSVINDETAEQWARTAAEHGGELRVIECVCSDVELHRTRIEGRKRNIPNWHEIDWEHVERMRVRFPPLTVDKLTVDAVEPLETNLGKVRAYLAAESPGVPVPRDSLIVGRPRLKPV
ncbi:AAA family ATPase [Glycomyces sp. NPDC046736]|uniref:AAA family ATPase n=1 Tax=Glycomyces sp. NPDC046736 TaxID=3155615 RepID=UPI0033EFB499